MKKILLITTIILVGVVFAGCQKKSTVSITAASSSTPIPETLQQIDSSGTGTKPTSSTTSTTSQAAQSQSFVSDGATVDNTFQQNYQVALDDAQKALRSGVKYCGAKISFYGATLAEANQQSFIFYSDDFSKDYYWVVSLNGYQDNQKTRSFAAKKDLSTELKCMTNTGSAPGTFSDIYDQLTKTDQFKKVDVGTIAQTTLETTDTGWSVAVVNNAGESIIVNTINPQTATQAVTAPKASVSAITVTD